MAFDVTLRLVDLAVSSGFSWQLHDEAGAFIADSCTVYGKREDALAEATRAAKHAAWIAARRAEFHRGKLKQETVRITV